MKQMLMSSMDPLRPPKYKLFLLASDIQVLSTTCQVYSIIISFFQRIFHHFIFSVFEIPLTSTNFTRKSNRNIQTIENIFTTSTKKNAYFP